MLRERVLGWAALAAEKGCGEATDLLSLTPREAALVLSAHRAKREEALMDQWRLSRLVALAVHAPDRLPPRPLPAAPPAPLPYGEMKRRLLAWRGKEASTP